MCTLQIPCAHFQSLPEAYASKSPKSKAPALRKSPSKPLPTPYNTSKSTRILPPPPKEEPKRTQTEFLRKGNGIQPGHGAMLSPERQYRYKMQAPIKHSRNKVHYKSTQSLSHYEKLKSYINQQKAELEQSIKMAKKMEEKEQKQNEKEAKKLEKHNNKLKRKLEKWQSKKEEEEQRKREYEDKQKQQKQEEEKARERKYQEQKRKIEEYKQQLRDNNKLNIQKVSE